nr:MAG TPA: hypothetical protein [Caudoviricetes sp.]
MMGQISGGDNEKKQISGILAEPRMHRISKYKFT